MARHCQPRSDGSVHGRATTTSQTGRPSSMLVNRRQECFSDKDGKAVGKLVRPV